jgi:hypothetical protein
METVFKGKGDRTENRLLQQMLTEFSKFELGLTMKETPLERRYEDFLRSTVAVAPVIMVIEVDHAKTNHLIEVIDMDSTDFIVRNAYSDGEIVHIPISNLWRDPPKVDWLGDKCQIKTVFTFKIKIGNALSLLPKLSGQQFQTIHETAEVVRALVDEFVQLPKTKSMVEEPICVEEGECALVYRVLRLVYGHTKDVIDSVMPLDPCPPLEGWVKLVQTNFKGHLIESSFALQQQINQAVSIVAANEIEGHFDLDRTTFLELMSDISTRAIYARLFPHETSLYTSFDVSLKDNEKLNPLPEILDRIENGDTKLKEVLTRTPIIRTNADDFADFLDREDADFADFLDGDAVRSPSRHNRTLSLSSSSSSSKSARSPKSRKSRPKIEYLD